MALAPQHQNVIRQALRTGPTRRVDSKARAMMAAKVPAVRYLHDNYAWPRAHIGCADLTNSYIGVALNGPFDHLADRDFVEAQPPCELVQLAVDRLDVLRCGTGFHVDCRHAQR